MCHSDPKLSQPFQDPTWHWRVMPHKRQRGIINNSTLTNGASASERRRTKKQMKRKKRRKMKNFEQASDFFVAKLALPYRQLRLPVTGIWLEQPNNPTMEHKLPCEASKEETNIKDTANAHPDHRTRVSPERSATHISMPPRRKTIPTGIKVAIISHNINAQHHKINWHYSIPPNAPP